MAANPCTNVSRLTGRRESADSHLDPLTAHEVRTLLATAKERYAVYYPLMLCAARTGMRQGELIGLQWGDVDFHGQFIEVRRAVVRRKITTTKTHKIRRVDMSPQLATALQILKETRQLDAGLAGHAMPEWVFLSPFGHRVDNDLLRKAFAACLEASGLRKIRFHDLRHTYASLLIQQGANPKYIQEQLGHSSISITLDIYSHLFRSDHQPHVARLDDPQETNGRNAEPESQSATSAQPQSVAFETIHHNLL